MQQLYVLTLLVVTSFSLAAQQLHKCNTNEMTEKCIQLNPKLKEIHANYYQDITNFSKKNKQLSDTTIRIIPIVFHVIHNDGDENISKEQIKDQVRILNEDYRRLNADTVNTNSIFKSIAADSKIEFRLASVDPAGNCTDGIVRLRSYLTENAKDEVKALSWWDNTKYLNVWVVKSIDPMGSSGTVLGYAYYPDIAMLIPEIDGIIIRSDYVGSIGTAKAGGDPGRTLTHEVGHYLGLPHTFDDGCSNSGDGISDTPPAKDPNYGCPTGVNSCSTDNPNLIDQIENYMDYSNGSCMNMFSQGQKAVFDNTFLAYRNNLISSSNLLATGVADGMMASNCAPQADFMPDKDMVCLGEKINFTDLSWNGSPTSWEWTFQGGNPSTSTDSSPTVQYDTAGLYTVSLKVSNNSGSDTYVRNSLIRISSTSAKYQYPYQDGFETSSQFNSDWTVYDADGVYTFGLKSNVGYTGSSCLKMSNFGNTAGQVDEIIGPSLDVSALTTPKINFGVSYAQKNNDLSDALKVYVSEDCGETWNLRYSKSGSSLATVSSTKNSSFTPSSQADWRQETISIPSSLASSHLLFKFTFTSDGGNNLYIDDINLTTTSALYELDGKDLIINVYPTPVVDLSQLELKFNGEAMVKVALYDIVGKKIKDVGSGKYREQCFYEINRELISTAGIYYLMIEVNGLNYAHKIAVK